MYLLSKLFGSIFRNTNMGYEKLLNEMYLGGNVIKYRSNGITLVLSNGRVLNFWTGGGYTNFGLILPTLKFPFLYKARLWDAVQHVITRG